MFAKKATTCARETHEQPSEADSVHICTSLQRQSKDNIHTPSCRKTHTREHTCQPANTRRRKAQAHTQTHECEKNNVAILNWKTSRKNLSAAVFTSSSPDPLGPSSTETKRMIEHQSSTVTQRDSILRQKQRRQRRSQHLNGTAKKLRTTSGRNV